MSWSARQRHWPYGQVRYLWGSLPTTYNFTGQRLDASTGLVYYGARYYDPALMRFTQPDTLVPDPANPQSLNRYAYVLNNPLRYTDPTGHIAENEARDAEKILAQLLLYGVNIAIDWGWMLDEWGNTVWNEGAWTLDELRVVEAGVKDLAGLMGGADQFTKNLGGVTIVNRVNNPANRGETIAHLVGLKDGFDQWTVVHELAHAWDVAQGGVLSRGLEQYTGGSTTFCIVCYDERYGTWRLFGEVYIYGGVPSKGADASFTRAEDFAESVATFLDPQTAQFWIANFYGNRADFRYQNYYTTSRAHFVAQAVNMSPQELKLWRDNAP